MKWLFLLLLLILLGYSIHDEIKDQQSNDLPHYTTMIAQHLGHVVFYVRDLNRSLTFYRDLLRFDEVGKIGDHVSALTSGRTHHEILLIEVGDAPGPMQGKRIGLYHIGIKIGNTLNELRLLRD